jgi:WD repeat and SOF domain-containing protein 1
LPFDPSRNWPDLGPRFSRGEKLLREAAQAAKVAALEGHDEAASVLDHVGGQGVTEREDMDDEADLSWATVLKRTFEAYLRAERPNMYGEWITW